ncbi:hypothetical protein PPYR_00318 [Photinus pyralis]|uniref:DDE Tnp4 domain-containing protein n=2 Tax=Photinus pyralis TaxID=7054 RepID=A0A5N4B1F4_PHOPY|nr:putative nuclease HARBI1 [Photinus pyralis]KAB0803348.1 hypothetical protein PPYR_00318 [Photinus pyralis]
MSLKRKCVALALAFLNDDDVFEEFNSSDDETEYTNSIISQCRNLIQEHKKMCISNINPEHSRISITEQYSDEEIIRNFRLSRSKINYLVDTFSDSTLFKDLYRNNSRGNITPEKHILTFLWFAGHHTASYRDVADKFNLSLSSLHDVITRIMMFLSNVLALNVIKLPSSEQKQTTMNFYHEKNKLPNVIGCIDATHIKIDKQNEPSVNYSNSQQYFSHILQAVCNEELNFLDIYVGCPGSVHDANVFKSSALDIDLETICDDGGYLLGDEAYPNLPTLLTPYQDHGNLTSSQIYFNLVHNSCRSDIDHAFQLLKKRFKQLYHLKLRGDERICHFIRACCTLHNLADKSDETIFAQEDDIEDNQPDSLQNEDPPNIRGNTIRDEICVQLFQHNK